MEHRRLFAALAGAALLYVVLVLAGYSHATLPIFANGDARVTPAGLYQTERSDALTWTWTTPHATLSFPTLDRTAAWTFTAHVLRMRPAGTPSPSVRISVDGRVVAEALVNGSAADLTVGIPAARRRGFTVGIDVSPPFVPGPADPRELGVAIASMSLSRSGTLAWPRVATVIAGIVALVLLAMLLLGVGMTSGKIAAVLLAAAAAQAWFVTRPVLLYSPYPAGVIASYLALAAAVLLVVAARARPAACDVITANDSPRRNVSWRPFVRIAAIGVLYAAACRVMLAPVFNFGALQTASYEGDARVFIWALAWDNHVVLDRLSALFDANVLYPMPHALAYFEHVFAISLFTLPIYAATRNPVLAYNVIWIFCFLTTAAAVHLVAWRRTRDHVASIVAGMSFAFCFFRMHHAHHIELIWCAFIPLSFIAVERWVQRPTWRRLAVIVTMVLLQGLSGWYEGVFIAVADLLLLAWLLLAERRRVPLRRCVVQGVVAAAATTIIVWPFARYYFALHQSSPAYAASASADLVGWFVPPENTFAGQWLLARGIDGPRPIWGEVTVYLGWVTLLLATAGAIVTVRENRARRSGFFVVLALVAGALALGPSPIEVATGSFGSSPYGVLSHIPGLRVFRNPARYTELVSLALAMLAAVACAAAHRRFGTAARVASAVVTGVLLAEVYVVKFPGGPPQPFTVPAIYARIAALPPGPVMSLPDYANTPLWFYEADYQYFSTAHWHPIVNGDAREFPPPFVALKSRLQTFPTAASVAAMRQARIAYVVLHGARSTPETVAAALASPAYELLATVDADYLFRLRPR